MSSLCNGLAGMYRVVICSIKLQYMIVICSASFPDMMGFVQ